MQFKKVIIIILLVFWCGIIFSASNKDNIESNRASREVITIGLKSLVTIANKLSLTSINIDSTWLDETVNKLNYPLRKCAHAAIYFILGILIFLLLHNLGLKNYQTIILTIILCFCYSLTDEYHQTFIESRTGQFSDCLIDTAGAIASSSLLYIFISNKNKKTTKKVI